MASDVELREQTNIIKSVRQDGGYARKASNRFAIGIPDLTVALPPFAPCLIEVKTLGEVIDNFDRKVEVTDKQSEELKRFGEAYEDMGLGRVSFVAVHIVHRKQHRLVLGPRQMSRLSAAYEADSGMWTPRQVGGYYDMAKLLRRWSAARVVHPETLPR